MGTTCKHNDIEDIDEQLFVIRDFTKDYFKNLLKCKDTLDEKFILTKLNVNFEYLYNYLNDLDCKLILLEPCHVDEDFMLDYLYYYGECYKNLNRYCRRLHFFKVKFNKLQFLKYIKNDQKYLRSNYLGFIVAKPLPEIIIGKTILPPKSDSTNESVFPCIIEYQVNLFGVSLPIRSLAFQEQDKVSSKCATTALWSAFHKTVSIFDKSWLPSPVEITKLATKYDISAHQIPNLGLNISQMCHAIRGVGLEPYIFEIENKDPSTPLLSLIYSYLHAGIPVILGADVISDKQPSGLHAITLNGYHLSNNEPLPREVPYKEEILYFNLIGRRIDEFYAHDDQLGPFCKIKIHHDLTVYPLKFYSNKPNDEFMWKFIKPINLIIPIHAKIRVHFIDVYQWIHRLNIFIYGWEIKPKNSLEWEIYLMTSIDYKEIKLKETDINEDFNSLFKIYPKYIWRCVGWEQNEKKIEIIVDATDMPHSFFIIELNFYDENLKNNMKEKMENARIIKTSESLLTPKFIQFILENINKIKTYNKELYRKKSNSNYVRFG